MERWFSSKSPKNAKLISALPKEDYDKLIRVCDEGLIFLDFHFTIPNFPSRLLGYLENSMPVLLATDVNTDMGQIAQKEEFGLWCESGDLGKFLVNMDKMDASKIKSIGDNGYKYLTENYTVSHVSDIIEKL